MGNSFYRQIIFHSTNKLRKNVSLALTILKNDPKINVKQFSLLCNKFNHFVQIFNFRLNY
ncbi:MAG: hypothetical protein JWQ66_754 [Mucilaginibacter sp.]|nr:hypothetical protein [Mucilaginibacter sp.]